MLDSFFDAELAELSRLLAAPLSVPEKVRQSLIQMMAASVEELQIYRSIWLEEVSVIYFVHSI